MERKLERNEHSKMIAGVASGLSDYLVVDVTIIRICFILLAVFGAGVLVYIVMWIAIPEKPFFKNFTDIDPAYQPAFNSTSVKPPAFSNVKKSENGRMIAGSVLILVGGYFMLNEFGVVPHWFSLFKVWPAILIVFGAIIIFRSGEKKPKVFPEKNDGNNSTITDEPNVSDNQPLT